MWKRAERRDSASSSTGAENMSKRPAASRSAGFHQPLPAMLAQRKLDDMVTVSGRLERQRVAASAIQRHASIRTDERKELPGRLTASAESSGTGMNANVHAQGTDILFSREEEGSKGYRITQMKGQTPVNDDVALEHEADMMGAHAAAEGDTARWPAPNFQTAVHGGSGSVMQRKVAWDAEGAATMRRYAPKKNSAITSSTYKSQYQKVDELAERVMVLETDTVAKSEGNFTFEPGLVGGVVRIHPLAGDATAENPDFNDNIAVLGHEFQHALDRLGDDKIDAFDVPEEQKDRRYNILHTEWRAWAIEAAIGYQHCAGSVEGFAKMNEHQMKMLHTYMHPDTRTADGNHFLRKTHRYLNDKVASGTAIEQARLWMLTDQKAQAWWKESLAIFHAHTAGEQGASGSNSVAGNAVEAEEARAVQTIDTAADFDSKAPGLKHGGTEVEKVKKEDGYRIVRFRGHEYRIAESLMELGYFDTAKGKWA